jgi:hypothetical protein
MAGFDDFDALRGHAVLVARDDQPGQGGVPRPVRFDSGGHAGCRLAAANHQGAATGWRRQVARQDACGVGCSDSGVKRTQQQLACAFCLHINSPA